MVANKRSVLSMDIKRKTTFKGKIKWTLLVMSPFAIDYFALEVISSTHCCTCYSASV